MSSNIEGTLVNYYIEKVLAERDCAIVNAKNEVLIECLKVCFIIIIIIIIISIFLIFNQLCISLKRVIINQEKNDRIFQWNQWENWID